MSGSLLGTLLQLPSHKHELNQLCSRVVALAESSSSFDFLPFMSSFVGKYRLLQEGHAIAAGPTNVNLHDAIRPPQIVILQVIS